MAMLQDSGRSRVISCHSRDVGNMLLYDYHLKNIKWWPGKDVVWVLVGVRSCVTTEAGHSLVTPFFPVWSVKDQSLHMTLGRSQTYYLEHLCMGAWKTCCSLVADPALSKPTIRFYFWWRRSLYRTESGT